MFPDALNAQVIAERFTERAERFILNGKGFDRRRTQPDSAPIEHHARLRSVRTANSRSCACRRGTVEAKNRPRATGWAPGSR